MGEISVCLDELIQGLDNLAEEIVRSLLPYDVPREPTAHSFEELISYISEPEDSSKFLFSFLSASAFNFTLAKSHIAFAKEKIKIIKQLIKENSIISPTQYRRWLNVLDGSTNQIRGLNSRALTDTSTDIEINNYKAAQDYIVAYRSLLIQFNELISEYNEINDSQHVLQPKASLDISPSSFPKV